MEQRVSPRPGTLVLLARLVDRDGDAIGADDIRSIEFVVHRLDCAGEREARAPANSIRQRVSVAEVIVDDWRQAGDWTPSGDPFNFCHELPLPTELLRGGEPARLEIEYLITHTTGERTFVRFRIRNDGHD